jgi:hypothetical protein
LKSGILAINNGRLSTESSRARGRFLKEVLRKKFLTTGLYNSVPSTEKPTMMTIALKFICKPVSSPLKSEFSPVWAFVNTNAVTSVINTKSIQNLGLES